MGKRNYGTGHVYIKWGSYYGRWRTLDRRLVNRKLGKVRPVGQRSGGLTRVQAEREMARKREEEDRAPRPAPGAEIPTVDQIADCASAQTLADLRTREETAVHQRQPDDRPETTPEVKAPGGLPARRGTIWGTN